MPRSFIETTPESHFPLENLPYGVFRPTANAAPRIGTAIGDYVLDLSVVEQSGLFEHRAIRNERPFSRASLNQFMRMGRDVWQAARSELTRLLEHNNPRLRDDDVLRTRALHRQADVEMLLPVEVGDYTDFYSSREHATNVGTIFRGEEDALQPNWLHLPVAYHGRASSIVVSGTDVRRPFGQLRPDEGRPPVFGATRLLDFELEVGFFIGPGTELGRPIPVESAADHIFGLVLVNDWSARDIQKWEYVPLGPFLGKNFATTVSPWVVTLEALEPFAVEPPKQDPEPLAYLRGTNDRTFDIHLEASIRTSVDGADHVVARSNYRHLYWTMAQQLAHHTVNGCNVRPGDLMASGTISSAEPGSYGSLLELTWKGSKPVELPDGSKRTFLEDGDVIRLTGWAQGDGFRVGFGAAEGRILPARFEE